VVFYSMTSPCESTNLLCLSEIATEFVDSSLRAHLFHKMVPPVVGAGDINLVGFEPEARHHAY